MEVDQEMSSKKIMTFLLALMLCIIVEVSSMEMNLSVSMVAEKGKESETENVTFKQISCMSNSSSVKCPPRYFREILQGKSWDLKASECKTTGSKLPVVSQYNLTIIAGFTIYLSAHGFINRIYFCDKGHQVVLTKMKFQASYCHRNGRLPFMSIQRYWSLQERKDWFLHQETYTVFRSRLQFLFQSISALNFKLQFQNEVCTILIQITICQKHICIQDSTAKTVLQVIDLGHKVYKQKLEKQSIIKMCLSLVTKKLNIETCDIYKQPVLSVNKTIMCHIYTCQVLYFAQRDSLVLVHSTFMCVSCIYLKSKSKNEVLPSIYESEGSKLVTLTTNFICIKLPFICILHILENISIHFIWKLNTSKLVTSCSTLPFTTLQSSESIHLILSGIFCSSKRSIGLPALFSCFHCDKLLPERKRKNNLVLLYVTEINMFGITNSPNLLTYNQNIAQISFAEYIKKCLNLIQNSFIILLNIILLLSLTFYSTDLGGLFGFKNLSYFKILLIFGLVLTCEASSTHSHINTSYLFAHQPVLPKSTSLENVVYSSMQQDDIFSKSPLYISSASATFNITSDKPPKSYNMEINEVLRHSGTLTADKLKNSVLISNSNMVSTIIVTNYGTAYTDVKTNSGVVPTDTVKISSIVSIIALTSSDIEPTETIKNSSTVSNNALKNSSIEPWDTVTGSSTVSINALTSSGIELLAYNMQTLSSMSSIELQICSSMVSINPLTSYSMASTAMLTRSSRASTALLTSSSDLLKGSSKASSTDLLIKLNLGLTDQLTSSSIASTDLLTSSSMASVELLKNSRNAFPDQMIKRLTKQLTSFSMASTELLTSYIKELTDPLTSYRMGSTDLLISSSMTSTDLLTSSNMTSTDLLTSSSMTSTDLLSSMTSTYLLISSSMTSTDLLISSRITSTNLLTSSRMTQTDLLTSSRMTSTDPLTSSSMTSTDLLISSSMTSTDLLTSSSMTSSDLLTSSSVTSTAMQARYRMASSDLLANYRIASIDMPTNSIITSTDLLISSSMTSTNLLTSSSMTQIDLLTSSSMTSTDLLTISSMTQTDLLTSSSMTSTEPLTSSSMTSTDLLTSSSMTSTDPLMSSSMISTDLLTSSSMTSTYLLVSSNMTSTDLLISSIMTSTNLLTISSWTQTDLLTSSRMTSTDPLTSSSMTTTNLLTSSSMTQTDLLTSSRMTSTDPLTSSSMTSTDLLTSSRMTSTDPLTSSSMTSTDPLTSSNMTSTDLQTGSSMTSTDLLTSSSVTSTEMQARYRMASSDLLANYRIALIDMPTNSIITSTDLLISSSMTSTDLLISSSMTSTDLLTSSSMTQIDLLTSSNMTSTDLLTSSSMTSTDPLTSSSMTSTELLTSSRMTSTDLLISSSMTSINLLTSSSMTQTDLLTSSRIASTDPLTSSSMTSTHLLTSSSMTSTDLLTSSSVTSTEMQAMYRMASSDLLANYRIASIDMPTNSTITSTDILISSSMTSTDLLTISSMTQTDLLTSSSMTSTDLLTSSSMTQSDLLTSSIMASTGLLTSSSIAASNLVTSSSITSTVLLTSHGMASTELHTDYIMVHPDLSVIFTKITGKLYADLYSSSIKPSWDIPKGSITEFTDQLTMSTMVSTDWLMSSDMLSPDLLTKSSKVSTYLNERPNTVSRTQQTNFNTVFTEQQISSSSLIYDPFILSRKVSIDKITQSNTILINKLTRSKELSTDLVTHVTTELTDQITSSRMLFGDPLTSSFKIPITILKTSDRIYSDHLTRSDLISIDLVTGLNAVFNKLLSISTETYSEPFTSSSKVFTDNIKSFHTASSDNLLRSEIDSTEILLSYSISSADILSSSFIIPNDPLCKSHTAYIDPSTWYDVTSEIFETGFSVVFTDSLTNSKISPDFLTSSTSPSKLVTSTYVESNELQTSSTTSTNFKINPGLMSTNLWSNSRLILMNRLVGSSTAYPSLMTSFSKIFTDVFIKFSSMSTDQLTSYRMTGELLKNSSAVFTDNLTNSVMLSSDIETRPSITSTDQWKNSNEIFIYSQTTSSILSNDQPTWEISSTLSNDQLTWEISSTLSNDQSTREISSTLSNDQITREISSTLSNDQITREISSTLSNNQITRVISSTLSNDQITRVISSTLSNDQITRVISSTLFNDLLTRVISSTLSNDQITRVISSTLFNDLLTRVISSTLSNDQLTRVISSTPSITSHVYQLKNSNAVSMNFLTNFGTVSTDVIIKSIGISTDLLNSARTLSSVIHTSPSMLLTDKLTRTMLSTDLLTGPVTITTDSVTSSGITSVTSVVGVAEAPTDQWTNLSMESSDLKRSDIVSTDLITNSILSNDLVSSTNISTDNLKNLPNVSVKPRKNYFVEFTDHPTSSSVQFTYSLMSSGMMHLSSDLQTSFSIASIDLQTMISTDLLTRHNMVYSDLLSTNDIISINSLSKDLTVSNTVVTDLLTRSITIPSNIFTSSNSVTINLTRSNIRSTDSLVRSTFDFLMSSKSVSIDMLKHSSTVSFGILTRSSAIATDFPRSTGTASIDLLTSFSRIMIDIQTTSSKLFSDQLTSYNTLSTDLQDFHRIVTTETSLYPVKASTKTLKTINMDPHEVFMDTKGSVMIVNANPDFTLSTFHTINTLDSEITATTTSESANASVSEVTEIKRFQVSNKSNSNITAALVSNVTDAISLKENISENSAISSIQITVTSSSEIIITPSISGTAAKTSEIEPLTNSQITLISNLEIVVFSSLTANLSHEVSQVSNINISHTVLHRYDTKSEQCLEMTALSNTINRHLSNSEVILTLGHEKTYRPSTEITATPFFRQSPEITATPTLYRKSTEIIATPTFYRPSTEITATPTFYRPSTDVLATPTLYITGLSKSEFLIFSVSELSRKQSFENNDLLSAEINVKSSFSNDELPNFLFTPLSNSRLTVTPSSDNRSMTSSNVMSLETIEITSYKISVTQNFESTDTRSSTSRILQYSDIIFIVATSFETVSKISDPVPDLSFETIKSPNSTFVDMQSKIITLTSNETNADATSSKIHFQLNSDIADILDSSSTVMQPLNTFVVSNYSMNVTPISEISVASDSENNLTSEISVTPSSVKRIKPSSEISVTQRPETVTSSLEIIDMQSSMITMSTICETTAIPNSDIFFPKTVWITDALDSKSSFTNYVIPISTMDLHASEIILASTEAIENVTNEIKTNSPITSITKTMFEISSTLRMAESNLQTKTSISEITPSGYEITPLQHNGMTNSKSQMASSTEKVVSNSEISTHLEITASFKISSDLQIKSIRSQKRSSPEIQPSFTISSSSEIISSPKITSLDSEISPSLRIAMTPEITSSTEITLFNFMVTSVSPEMTFYSQVIPTHNKKLFFSAITVTSTETSLNSKELSSSAIKLIISELTTTHPRITATSETKAKPGIKSSTSPVSLSLNSDILSRSPNRTLRSEVISSAEIKSLAKIGILQPLTKTSWFSDTLSSKIMSSTSIMVSNYGTTSIIEISPLLSRKTSSNHNHISFKMTSNSEMISFIPNVISSLTSTSQILFQPKVTSSLSPEMTLFLSEMTSSSKMILSSSDSAFMSIQSSLSEITLHSQMKSTSLITSFNSKVTLSSSEITSSSDVMPRIYETTTLSHDKTSTSSLITSSSEIKASFDSTLIIPEIFTFDEKTLNSEIMTSYKVTSLVSKIRSSSLELISSSKIQASSEIKSVPLGITPSSSDTTLLSFAVTPKSEINASVTSKSEGMTSSSGLLSKSNNLSTSETTDPFKISTSDATSHSKITSIIYETNTMNPGPILNSDIQSRFQITSAIFEMKTSSSLDAISKHSEKPLSGMTKSRVNTLPSISEIMPSDSWVTSRVDIRPLGSRVTSRVDIRSSYWIESRMGILSSSYWIESRMGILSSSSEIKSTDSRIITVVDILPSNSDIIIGFGVTSGVEVLLSSFGITSRFEVLSSSPGMMLSTSFSMMQSVSTSVTIPMTTAQEKVTDILLLKVKVKKDVDIFGDKFSNDTVRGLMECFKEGRAQSPHNRKQRGITMWERKNVHQLREMLPGNIEVKITDVSRDKKTLETVIAQFYVKENGVVVPVKEAAAVYGQLTIQEISALLTYPVLQSIMPAAAIPNIAPNNEEFFTPMTITLICIPAGVLVLATIVLLLIFCRTRWKQKESSAKYWRKYSSIVKRKPTLTDYDLMIDMEMGEVINASHSPGQFSLKNLHNWKKETYNESTIVKQVPELDVKQLFELSKFPSTMLQQALSTKSQAYSDSELLWKQLVWKLSMEKNNKVMTFSEPKSKDALTSGKHLVDEMIQTDFDNSEKNRKVKNNTLVNKTAETVTNVLPRRMAQTILNTSPVSKHRKSQFKNKTTPIKYGILSLPNRVDLISKSGEEFSNKMFTEPGDFEISLTSAKDYKQKQLKNENANSLVSDSGRVVHHSNFTSSIGGLPMEKVPIMKNSVKDEKISTTIPTIFYGGKMSLFSDISSLDDTSGTQDKQLFLFRQREPHAVAQQETKVLKDLKQLGKEKPYKSGKQTESDILFTNMTKRKTKQKLKYPQKYPNIPVEGYCNRILEKPFYTKLTLSSVKQKLNAEDHDQSEDNGDTSKNMFCTPKNELTPLQQNSEMDSDFAYCLIDDGHLMQTDDYDSGHEFYPIDQNINHDYDSDHEFYPVDQNINHDYDSGHEFYPIDQNINHDDDSDQETYPMYENVSPIFLEYFGGFYDVPQSTLHFGNFRSEEFDDGSEFAGYEFEALNFGLRSNYPHQNPVNQSYNTIMEPNAAIFEHVTKMGRIGIPTAHQSEPVYRQPSYDFDDLTDTPMSTERSSSGQTENTEISDHTKNEVYVDMKLGRNMRARPRQTNDGRSNGQTSDKLDCAVTDPLLPLTANSSTSAAVEFFCHMHSRMPDLGTSNISYLTNNSSSLSRTIASPQHPTQDLIETLNRQKQTRRQLEVEKEHHQAKAETKRWKTEDSLHRIDFPSDQKEQTSAKVPPLDTESQSDLTKSKNVGYIHERGVRTEKDNDEDDDFVLEKNDSSKEDSDINDF